MLKWILTGVGYLYRGVLGGVLGFLIGVLLERSGWFGGGEKQSASPEPTPEKAKELNFELNILALCAVVISADGNASVEELHYVRNAFIRLYGAEKAQRVFQLYNKLKAQHPPLRDICFTIGRQTTYQTRLQIVHFLFDVASVDGVLHTNEIRKIQEIANFFRISQQDFLETLRFFSAKNQTNAQEPTDSLSQAYNILGISPTATDAQLKQAYREMAKKYHPDRVLTSDEAIKKSAEEKFKKVQWAYEQIQKYRNK